MTATDEELSSSVITIQELHKQAMDLVEAAFTAKLRGDLKQASQV
ncbi:MAG: hypothetical protein ACYTXA_10195 [Nostoc sp.]